MSDKFISSILSTCSFRYYIYHRFLKSYVALNKSSEHSIIICRHRQFHDIFLISHLSIIYHVIKSSLTFFHRHLSTLTIPHLLHPLSFLSLIFFESSYPQYPFVICHFNSQLLLLSSTNSPNARVNSNQPKRKKKRE